MGLVSVAAVMAAGAASRQLAGTSNDERMMRTRGF
jgi:hypothetical protein